MCHLRLEISSGFFKFEWLVALKRENAESVQERSRRITMVVSLDQRIVVWRHLTCQNDSCPQSTNGSRNSNWIGTRMSPFFFIFYLTGFLAWPSVGSLQENQFVPQGLTGTKKNRSCGDMLLSMLFLTRYEFSILTVRS